MAHILVLGGTSFVGRAVVSAALAAGHEATTLNRGRSGADVPGVRPLHADRNDVASMADALAGKWFDLTIDVSGLAAAQVETSARILSQASARYIYVSTVSVYDASAYRTEQPITESAATMPDADPDDPSAPDMARYGVQKRAAELALARRFDSSRRLVVRPGIILGPHENVHRIPYWLGRIAEGGHVLVPGEPQRPLQYVDVRDLAAWLVQAGATGASGTFNAVNPFGRDTWEDWVTACRRATGSDASFAWAPDAVLREAGVRPGFTVPMWMGRDLPGFDHRLIERAGFTFRPLADTVAASWEWLRGLPATPPGGYRPAPMSRAEEQRILRILGS